MHVWRSVRFHLVFFLPVDMASATEDDVVKTTVEPGELLDFPEEPDAPPAAKPSDDSNATSSCKTK